MKETNTTITWPSKLKIGAKSKKGISLVLNVSKILRNAAMFP